MTAPERRLTPSGAGPSRRYLSEQIKRWRAEFPYHWDADDLVARRDLLQLAVYTSGALFASTAVLAVFGLLRRPRQTAPQLVGRVGEIPVGEAHYFHYPNTDDEAVLIHLDGGQFVAYSQICTHLACSVYYQAERTRLYCPCHEGVFSPLTGDPVAGPPQRALPRIRLRQEGEMLYAVGIEP
jgi:Rieske Fe-S protein